MSAEFVSLADLLRATAATPAAALHDACDVPAVQDDVPAARDAGPAAQADGAANGIPVVADFEAFANQDVAGALRDARMFRARLADALDDAVARLVRELAAEVLVRELRLAPCEIAALVRRVLQRAPIVRVRVAPADVALVRGVPVLADPELAAGDAIVELGGGALDARLGVRLAAVLEAFA